MDGRTDGQKSPEDTIWILTSLVTLLAKFIVADPIHPHEHEEVRIVGYNGKLDEDHLSLFRGVKSLTILDSNITSCSSSIYSKLPKLRKVHLENVTFQNVAYDTVLNGAHKIEEVIFINNAINEVHFETIVHMPALEKLVLKDLKIAVKVVPRTTYNHSQFKDFELINCGIERIEDGAFIGLDKLEILDLSKNKLKEVTKEVLTPLKSLKSLYLTGNLIEAFGAENLPELPHLEKICLCKNPLKKLDLEGMDKVAPNLKTILVKDTSLSKSQVEELKKKTKIELIDEKVE